MVRFNFVPFWSWNFSQRREIASRGSEWREFASRGSESFPLRAVPYTIEKHFNHIVWPPLNVTISITHVRDCVMGATPIIGCLKTTQTCHNNWLPYFFIRTWPSVFSGFRVTASSISHADFLTWHRKRQYWAISFYVICYLESCVSFIEVRIQV